MAKRTKAPRRTAEERRQQTAAATQALARQRIEAEIEADRLKREGPPALEEKIKHFAAQGAEEPDIALKLGIAQRLSTDAELKQTFDRLVAEGQAELRITLARNIIEKALDGSMSNITKEVAQAWLAKHMDEAPSTEFASGYRAKLEELLGKLNDEQHGHVIKKFRFEG